MFNLIIYSILLGLFLEILQHLLPFGRYFDLADFIANSIGVLFGAFILYYLKKKLL
jgi:glycopeptide antibiotics resistance protein